MAQMKVEHVIENIYNRNFRYYSQVSVQQRVCVVVLDTGGRKDLLRRSAVHLGSVSVFAEGALMFITTGLKGMRGEKNTTGQLTVWLIIMLLYRGNYLNICHCLILR